MTLMLWRGLYLFVVWVSGGASLTGRIWFRAFLLHIPQLHLQLFVYPNLQLIQYLKSIVSNLISHVLNLLSAVNYPISVILHLLSFFQFIIHHSSFNIQNSTIMFTNIKYRQYLDLVNPITACPFGEPIAECPFMPFHKMNDPEKQIRQIETLLETELETLRQFHHSCIHSRKPG